MPHSPSQLALLLLRRTSVEVDVIDYSSTGDRQASKGSIVIVQHFHVSRPPAVVVERSFSRLSWGQAGGSMQLFPNP